jgi:transketolase
MNYENILKKIALEDERYVVMTAENRAPIRNLPQALGKRFIDTGITEQTMIGAAAGLALRGRIPVVHALAAFLTLRGFEFIRTDVGLGNLPVKLVGYVPGFLSEANGPTHQAIEDVSLLRGIPNMCVFCPADHEDLSIGLERILKDSRPFYIRFNHLNAVCLHNKEFEIGKAEVVSEGTDITLLTYGTLFGQAYEAVKQLQTEGVSVRLVNMRCLKPIDEEVIIAAARETNMIVTIEDHFLTGGLFTIVAEILVKNGLSGVPVKPMAMESKWFKPALLSDVLNYEGFTSEHIVKGIMSEMEKLHEKMLNEF